MSREVRLISHPAAPPPLTRLHDVLEECVAKSRQTRPTVSLLKRHLDPLRDGLRSLQLAFREASPYPDPIGKGPGEKWTGPVN